MSGLYISITFFWSVSGNHKEPDGRLFFTGCCFNPPKAIRRDLAVVYVMWIILGTFLSYFSKMPVKESGFWSFQSPAFCNPSPFAVSSKGHLKSLVTFEGIAKKVRMIFFSSPVIFSHQSDSYCCIGMERYRRARVHCLHTCLLIWYFKIQMYSYKWCLTARIYINTQFLISLLLTFSKQGYIHI